MRISNYPTDTITGTELILASNYDTLTQAYTTVNFSADTLKTYVLGTGSSNNTILFEGTTEDLFDGTLTSIAADSSKTYTLPNITGHVALFAVTPTVPISATPEEINIVDASAGNTAVTSDVAASAGAVESNNYKISHTLILNATLADDAEHADIVITSDKVLATSVIIVNASIDVHVNVHTVVVGSFKIRITNKSGGTLADDSTMIINYRII